MAKKLTPLIQACFCTTSPTPIKYALSLLGFKTKAYRLPIVPPNDAERKRIEDAMRAYGLLDRAAVSA
jgi:4-hydroxy-tetrahydrodipicolinate synthase